MSSELDSDGKGALLRTSARSTAKARAAAFRTVCRRTKSRAEEDQVLWLLGLHYKPEPTTQEGRPA